MVAPLIIGALVTAAQAAQQADQEKRQRALQSEMTRYSPWTKMTGDPSQIKPVDWVGDIGSGVQAGSAMADYNAKNPAVPKAAAAAPNQVPMAGAGNGGMGLRGAAPGGSYDGGASAITGAPGAAGAAPSYAGPTRPGSQAPGGIWDVIAQMQRQQNPQG